MSQMPIVKMMETAPSAARESLKVLAVFVAVVGLGFHDVGGDWGSIELTENLPFNLSSISILAFC
jgi:hypothetical protein